MPFYDIRHALPLTAQQQEDLANAITIIHTEMFTVPKLFVNVAFTDVSARVIYVAGQRKKQLSHILAHIRQNSGLSREDLERLTEEIESAWISIVGEELPEHNRECTVLILSDIVSAKEKGLMTPAPGEDYEWLKRHLEEFRQLAKSGDPTFRYLLEEIEMREVFRKILD